MRLFLGFDIPYHVKHLIHEYLLPMQTSLKGWENPHDYHQTLLFIGEVNEEERKEVEKRMEGFSFNPFTITPSRFQFFNRRIMFLGFRYSLELLELKNKIDLIWPEWAQNSTKEFIPHVTVKRWQRYEFEDLKEGLNRNYEFPPFQVNALSLFLSQKDEQNRKYHVIKSKLF